MTCISRVISNNVLGLALPAGDVDLVIDENSPGFDFDNNILLQHADRVGPPSSSLRGLDREEAAAVKESHAKANAVLRILRHDILAEGIANSIELVIRVPVLKLKAKSGNIQVDLSFHSLGGPQAAQWAEEWLIRWPAIRPLVLFVKSALGRAALNEPKDGGVSSYAILCMVIHHLQRNHLQANADDPFQYLYPLLLSFLVHFGRQSGGSTGHFYRRDVLVLGPLHLQGFSTTDIIKSKDSLGYFDTRSPDLLAIEDPLSPGNNIGRSASKINLIRDEFFNMHQYLCQQAARIETVLVGDQNRGRESQQASESKVQIISMLGTLVPVKKSEALMRSNMAKAYSEGSLDRILERLSGAPSVPRVLPPFLSDMMIPTSLTSGEETADEDDESDHGQDSHRMA